MKRIRIRMLVSIDQLYAGTEYNLPLDMANDFIYKGKAIAVGSELISPPPRVQPTFEATVAGPSETKPIEPTSRQVVQKINEHVKKGRKRG